MHPKMHEGLVLARHASQSRRSPPAALSLEDSRSRPKGWAGAGLGLSPVSAQSPGFWVVYVLILF